MHLYPDNAAEKLGFGIVMSRVASYLRTEAGRELLDKERPSSDMSVVTRRLAEVSDVQTLLQFDDPLSWSEVPDVREFLKRIRPAGGIPDPLDLLDLKVVATASGQLGTYLRPRTPKYRSLSRIADELVDLPDLRKVIAKSIGADGEILDAASGQLARIRRSISSREKELREALLRELRRAVADGYATEEQPTIRNGRMVIPVRAEAKRKVKGFIQDTSGTGQTVFIEPEACLNLNNDLRELQAEERQEERRILLAIGDIVRSHREELLSNNGALADFDVLHAKARVANALDARVPLLNDGGRLLVKQGRNPALALHFGREGENARDVIPLDIDMDSEQRTLLITGPNAGGKTVALGTIGLFTVMVGYGIPVPAAEGTDLPLFAKVYVDIGDEQSIENDLSTFSSHMRNVRAMVSGSDVRTLVLIDEAGTGTDPEEGAALAQAALEALSDAGAWTIATTHHGRLKAFAHEAAFARNAAMEFDLDSLAPTYRLRLDIPGSSYAFEIGRRMDLPQSLLDRARQLVGAPKMSLEQLIISYESRLARVASHEAEAERAMHEALAAKKEYETRRIAMERNRSQQRLEALEEAQQVVDRANAIVERTIREIRESQAGKATTQKARAHLDAHRLGLADDINTEKAAREVFADLENPEEEESSIEVGDQVVLDDGNAIAEVVEFDGGEAVIVSGASRMRVDPGRLRRVAGKRKQQVHVRRASSEENVLSTLGVSQRIDVRGQRVSNALTMVGHFIDEALPTSLNRLEVLHGTGTGALRKAIHDYLDERSDVASYDEAEWEQGGAGVTVVRLG